MNYELLAKSIGKPTNQWSNIDVIQWLEHINLQNLIPRFKQLSVDGSCIQILDDSDYEELGIKSNIIRKKLKNWIHRGFIQYNQILNQYLNSKQNIPPTNNQSNPTFHFMDSQLPITQFKDSMVITTYQGPRIQFYTINQNGCKIGKNKDNTIIVMEESAESQHAEIKYKNKSFYIKDLGTISGTFIKVSEQCQLKQGMIIEMGSFQFRCLTLNPTLGTLRLEKFVDPQSGDMVLQPSIIEINLNTKKIFYFGRRDSNDFYEDDQHLSGVHAKLYMLEYKFILEDLHSTNGTWIRLSQQKHISQFHKLANETIFKIGTTSTYLCKAKLEVPHQQLTVKKCMNCGFSDRNCLFQPCNHVLLCWECSQGVNKCSKCLIAVENREKLFL